MKKHQSHHSINIHVTEPNASSRRSWQFLANWEYCRWVWNGWSTSKLPLFVFHDFSRLLTLRRFHHSRYFCWLFFLEVMLRDQEVVSVPDKVERNIWLRKLSKLHLQFVELCVETFRLLDHLLSEDKFDASFMRQAMKGCPCQCWAWPASLPPPHRMWVKTKKTMSWLVFQLCKGTV